MKSVGVFRVLCIPLVFVLSVAGAVESTAGAHAHVTSWKVFEDPKLRFKIQYPVSWIVQIPPQEKNSGASPEIVQFIKPDRTATVSVLVSHKQDKTGAVQFLNQMDQSRKAINLIPELQRKSGEDLVKKTGASEIAIGFYEISGKMPVLQRALALKKGPDIFVVTGTFQKANEASEDPLIEAALTKFEFTTADKAKDSKSTH